MKRYQSNKIVEAAKIIDVDWSNRTILVASGAIECPTHSWWERIITANRNYIGGYYVRYQGGYDSWSPADVFEEGYTEVPTT